MSEELSLKEIKAEWHGSLKAYARGLLISFLLTATSFILTVSQILPKQLLIYSLVGLALTQAIAQLLFFLHLGQEAKPRWESIIFYFMVFILLIIAIGSLWIMNDLNARMMSMHD